MKKILGLAIAALLVMALVGGGTWAYFSDVETSTGNVFTAGTLDLTSVVAGTYTGDVGNFTPTEGGNGLNGNVVFGDAEGLKPGDSGSITWTLTNSGSLPGTLIIAATLTVDENDIGEPEQGVWVTGTATGGTISTLIDTVNLTQPDDYYTGLVVTITAGTANGDSREITDFDNATNTITVSSDFSFVIDATSVYEIADGGDDDEGDDLDGEFDEWMGVTLWRDGAVVYGGTNNDAYKPLSGLLTAMNLESQSMAGSGTIVYVLKWEIAANVKTTGTDGEFNPGDLIGIGGVIDVDDNVLQSDDAVLDITFTLTGS